MGMKETLKKIFSTSAETGEKHPEEKYRTRYYKIMKDKAMQEIQTVINNKSGYDVTSVSEDHGEIIVNLKKGKKAFVVITVIMVRPYRTAVDVSVSTETVFFSDFGFSRKVIEDIYNELDQKMTFVGTGLSDELNPM
ncbi:DUF1499 domain-containing protein [Salisediminibacterium halotolerans]|uniref:DUF1499 domain-containing protein n=1 Tax=Salisediminibacterium halotolerans TaxID=517425 RepID=A0A1H9U0U3_9BACI|nr:MULTISPECIES: DUF1499 domain-containing protein [Salisediminibacterium]RLJ80863.1 hypothetical protein BCL39_0253 [Actinophytocola xinjiangensis]RPE84038.1 hypothetical protein EDD67_2599 [Salisediminibacterium halotolerans]TWG37810.1 hypothetical protein BCL52_0252 [Salisediminibacterium halotolerans]SES02777.1 hypothetical protein SAMN05444126_1127 [Salisediminibacterium haloalkalitolerans]GEL08562.1 hypothetical protein SHA02_19780 [Salisediminibacterium halotolerans]